MRPRFTQRGNVQAALPDTVTTLEDGRLATRNMAPGVKVYDEDLVRVRGDEWRTWDPTRSKIGAYLLKGGRALALRRDSRTLYLGAANGTTVSHVSDACPDGVVWSVEFSPRSFRDLVRVADRRPNLLPFLADAWRPELYERFVGDVDVLFQDIAQRQQAAIFSKNVLRFKPALAMIAVKARSINVAGDPREVAREAGEQIAADTGYTPEEMIDLGPFERDHHALVLSRPG